MSSTLAALTAWLDGHGLADSERIAEQLMLYGDLLAHHNTRLNLVGRLDRQAIVRDLIVDALLPGLARPPVEPLMDVGSGAGLPGIPLAIAFPHVTMHLVEPRRKRVTFMSIALRRLALTNVTVHEQRLDEVVAVQPGHVGTMAAKAFQNPHVWLQTAQQWLRPDGMVYMYASEASWDHNAQPPQGLRECARSPHPERSDRFGVVFEVT